MKNKKKIFSAFAVLALSAVTACAVFAGCESDDGEKYNEYGTTYYVSPEGKTDGTGAKNNPMNVSRLLGGNILKPGDTVLVQPGVYKISEKIQISRSGTYNHNITIKNASTTGEKAVLDFSEMTFDSTNRGVEVNANHIYWYGVDICGAGDNGMYIAGSYNTIEYSEFYNNRDTGLQLGRQYSDHKSIEQWPSYNLIKNCTSHNNYDNETYGENADGFAAKLTVGYGNVFDGCIAYRNSDDGWDLYAKSDSGNIGQVIIYNCVAFENGYLEYTQAECNALYPNFNSTFAESNTNSFTTRDGDGNGFKLGGSVMEGDVVVVNSLAYGNRMHGVTDNSNPGYLYVDGVTSYNNSAAIDNEPTSKTFGQIVAEKNHDEHNNIDVARQAYSYNTVKNTLSVKDGYAKSLGKDEYRGSVYNSMLLGTSKANKISGSLDADTHNEGEAFFTEQADSLVATEVFSKLPFTKSGEEYAYNLSGLKDMGADYTGGISSKQDRVHHKYRNADGSINMGEILAVKDYSKLFGDNAKIGAQLNKGSWADYTHFTEGKFSENVKSSIAATLEKAKESLYVTADAQNVYQNFDVPTKITGCSVSWTSSDESVLKVGGQYDVSLSGSEYVKVDVTRPTDADKKVKLTATVSYLGRSVQREIELNVKKDEPKVGSLYVVVGTTGEIIRDDGTVIFDGYHKYDEPLVKVINGAYKEIQLDNPELKGLTEQQYDITTKYEYATEDGKPYSTVASYSPNVAGVYRITHTVSLKGDASSSNSMSYKIFVASTDADLAWAKYDKTNVPEGGVIGADICSVSVNRLGYTISGRPNSAIGYLYSFVTKEDKQATAADFVHLDGENVVANEGVEEMYFRATNIEKQYLNANNAGYYIHYALANGKKEICSIFKEKVVTANIDTAENFKKLATTGKLGDENPQLTIYTLTKCLDLSQVKDWKSAGSFSGVLNGMGHTVSNLTVVATEAAGASIFSKVEGGSIMNIKFDNITLDGKNHVDSSKPFKQVGIVARSYGGYFYNIQITNIDARGGQSVGGLIGQIYENAPTYVERVSVANSDKTRLIDGPGNSVGGIVGLIQTNADPVVSKFIVGFKDCYTNLEVGHYRYSGGIVGRFDSQKVTVSYELSIESCLSACDLYASYNSAGGMIGAQQGNGKVTVKNSMFIGRLFHTYDLSNPRPLGTSQKNASGIFGAFVAAADVTVTGCISLIPEYNVAYQDGVEVETYFERISVLGGMFSDEVWNYHLEEGSDNVLEAPYVTLDFGTWECDCGAEAQ